MSIENTSVVDIISVNRNTGEVVLKITDHLSWGSDHAQHMWLLQEKLNTYLAFIESGELLEKYPDAKGRDVSIDVVGKYTLIKPAEDFFERASAIVKGAGFKLTFRVADE